MEPKHLVYLATILDRGSITAAAEHLSVAQPTLTRVMATLEMQAGRRLFTRSRFGVQSTEMGEALAREGRLIIANMESAREQVSRYQLGIHKELRIATGPVLSLAMMVDVVDRVSQENPNIALNISVLRPNEALNALMDDKVDVVIAPDPYERPIPSISKDLLTQDHIGIFCSRDHPLAQKPDKPSNAELAAADWLSLGLATPFEKQVLEMLTSGGVKRVRSRVVCKNDAVILFGLLSRGRHLSVLPNLLVSTLANQYRLQPLSFPQQTRLQRNIYMWAKQDIDSSDILTQFSQMLKEKFETIHQELADIEGFSHGN